MRILTVTVLLGFLIGPTHAADIVDRQAVCLAEFFRICGSPSNEQQVRSCITTHRASFSPACLELAKTVR